MTQTPAPGQRQVLHRGDTIEFRLRVEHDGPGFAWLRTNIGNAATRRQEIIEHAEQERPILARDWHDLKMRRTGERDYSIRLPLVEVGLFEAKTFFLREGHTEPLWPEGPNTFIKVEPAEYESGSSIYTAFVRQFGRNQAHGLPSQEEVGAAEMLEQLGYTVIPASGRFRDLIKELDFILGTLRFRIIQLLPIHPTPTTYARMGRFGSPFAALDFFEVDPALAEFDRRTTPIQQFKELLDAVHERGGRLFIDIPVNHTGWASRLQNAHPDWFARSHDSTFQSPGAWGVTWEDLSELDYAHRPLWIYMADMFLFWCRQGVDGFRCDAGYMIPFPVWAYIAARVRREFPDTVFMLEGLGGKQETMESLLSGAGLNWAYSELFQNYDQNQIERYLPDSVRVTTTAGLLVHFAETHDNSRLAATSPHYARFRTALSALCSQNGGFGITAGVEWCATEKIDVHGAPSLNWGAPENLIEHLARLNAILREHPCFHAPAHVGLIQVGRYNSIALLRERPDLTRFVLVAANLNDSRPSLVAWPSARTPFGGTDLRDLVTGRRVAIERHGDTLSCTLGPGDVLCLTPEPAELDAILQVENDPPGMPVSSLMQCLRAKALELWTHLHDDLDVTGVDVNDLASRLAEDPCRLVRELAGSGPPPVVRWQWPRDVKRTVMLPAGHVLCITARHRFLADLSDGQRVTNREYSLPMDGGGEFAILYPAVELNNPRNLDLSLKIYEPDHLRRAKARLLCLSDPHRATMKSSFSAAETIRLRPYVIGANKRNTLAQVQVAWGEIESQYDALLAANLNPAVPIDRRVLLTRCRAWVVYRGYSQPVNTDCLRRFAVQPDGAAVWRFDLPAGMGKLVRLAVQMRVEPDRNAVRLAFHRIRSEAAPESLDDREPIEVVLRPDIEDRSGHETTKAYLGAESAWPRAIETRANAFSFRPASDRALHVTATPGRFVPQPEWHYMVPHPFDAQRGGAGMSDLYSPGYFSITLAGGATARLDAEATQDPAAPAAPPDPVAIPPLEDPPDLSLREALLAAMKAFIVQRDHSLTMIAGYPWFLDWGRDTLICLRGVIAAGLLAESREILLQFGRFERNGTIPNMIRGNDDSNRDTSDAPLWFFVATADLLRAEGSQAFLAAPCGHRTMRDVLISIARGYIAGTPNGIRVDPESELVFSPSHFTWMDTNYPAGTPREGYPIEIQALWHAALSLLATLDEQGGWRERAERVRTSIATLFGRSVEQGLSDCLHAAPGVPAAQACADDAVRPNQLLAITLGAVTDHALCESILAATEELLVPGAIRSLADRPVSHPIPVHHHGNLLNDPVRPYWGRYRGDEDTRRKPAYHNGTAWTWQFPSYSEALFMTYGETSRPTASALLSSSVELINFGCVGHVPEIVDGDTPHIQRGCGAQAWGATELYRVIALLDRNT